MKGSKGEGNGSWRGEGKEKGKREGEKGRGGEKVKETHPHHRAILDPSLKITEDAVVFGNHIRTLYCSLQRRRVI